MLVCTKGIQISLNCNNLQLKAVHPISCALKTVTEKSVCRAGKRDVQSTVWAGRWKKIHFECKNVRFENISGRHLCQYTSVSSFVFLYSSGYSLLSRWGYSFTVLQRLQLLRKVFAGFNFRYELYSTDLGFMNFMTCRKSCLMIWVQQCNNLYWFTFPLLQWLKHMCVWF